MKGMRRTAAEDCSRSVAIIYNVGAWHPSEIRTVMDGVTEAQRTLEALEHRVSTLRVDHGVRSLVEQLETTKPDVIFNLCEGYREWSRGEYCIAGLLELLEIPYTGSGPIALGLALDKPLAKQLFAAQGVPTPPFVVYRQMPPALPSLAFPLILKLAEEDASVGITRDNVVQDGTSFRTRLQDLLNEFQAPVLVEEFIDGREFTVPMLDGSPVLIEEIQFQVEPRIVCCRAKWEIESAEYRGTIPVFAPALTARERDDLQTMAVRVWQTLGLRDYGRVDFRMDHQGQIYVLEANPNPDITSGSGYRRALDAAEIEYSEFIQGMINNALKRRSSH